MGGGAFHRRTVMADHSLMEFLVFAVATDECSLFVFGNESDATAYCEGLDVEAAGWFFWSAGGVPLEPEFFAPNTQGRFSVGNGRYRLNRAPPGHHADLAEVLDGIALLEPNPFFASVAEVKAHLAGQGGRMSVPGNGYRQGHGEHDVDGFLRRSRVPAAPRWLEIGVGLALMPFTLMCLGGR